MTRLCRHVCRVAAEADDFTSYVMLKLVENDYAVLRKFEGRCTIASFLIVVIRRAWSDYQTHLLGKFRASAEAERLGDTAMALEVLLRRDGRPLDEAVRALSAAGRTITRAEAESIAARLPERRPRPAHVELDDASQPQLALDGDAERALASRDRAAASSTVSATLRRAIAHLPAADQTLLRLKFLAGWSVADISRSLQEDQQRLYARLRAICRTLRKELVAAGIDAARVNEIIGHADVDLDFGLGHEQNFAVRPSSESERDTADEEQVRR